MSVRLCVVGGGRMGSALLAGLVAGGWAEPDEIAVAERVAAARDGLRARFPGVVVAEEPVAADGVLLAVKPYDTEAVCRHLAGLGFRHALSIAAGITSASLDGWLGGEVAVVRAMPNTPAQLGAGVSIIAGGPRTTEADLVWAEGILAAVGTVVRLPEALLDAATGGQRVRPRLPLLPRRGAHRRRHSRRARLRHRPAPRRPDALRGGADDPREWAAGRRAACRGRLARGSDPGGDRRAGGGRGQAHGRRRRRRGGRPRG